MVRNLPHVERIRTVLEGENSIASAVLNAPAVLSGLNADIYSHVAEAQMERTFGPQLREIERREEIAGNLNAAVDVVTSQFRKEAGLKDGEF